MGSIDWDYKYLTDQQLSGFEKYKYSCIDSNPLSLYIMHPFWNATVKLCPRWVAPNALTMAGFLFGAAGYLVLAWYDYSFTASSGGTEGQSPIPLCAFLSAAILLFLGYTLDGIDGKQARRTGTSGPLGELFDHGLDSWTAALIPVCLYSVFGRSPDVSIPPLRYLALIWNVFLTFYLTHWEKYTTGVLFLPWGYDLSMISTTLVFLSAYLFGPEAWQVFLMPGLSLGHVLELIFYLTSFCATLPVSVWNVYISYREKTAKTLDMNETMRPLISIFTLLIISFFWALANPDLVDRHPRVFYFITGTIFSNITCRLVVSCMSASQCEVFNWLMVPYSLAMFINLYLPGFFY